LRCENLRLRLALCLICCKPHEIDVHSVADKALGNIESSEKWDIINAAERQKGEG